MAVSEANQLVDVKLQRIEFLGKKLSEFQKAKVPDNAPESVAVSEPLGKTIGEMFVLCSCNVKLSSTDDCKWFTDQFKEKISPKIK